MTKNNRQLLVENPPRPRLPDPDWCEEFDTDHCQFEVILMGLSDYECQMRQEDGLTWAFDLFQEYGIWAWRIHAETATRIEEAKQGLYEDKELAKACWEELCEYHLLAIDTISGAASKYKIDATSIEQNAAYCRQIYSRCLPAIQVQLKKGHSAALYWPTCLRFVPESLTRSQIETVNLGQIQLHQILLAHARNVDPDDLFGHGLMPFPQGPRN